MKKRAIVISLGGSIIIPDKINYFFLNKFKDMLRKNYSKYAFIVVCGGGSIARKYISALKKEGKSTKEQSLAGIRATRMNAKFLMQFFGKEANNILPKNMKEVKHNIKKNNAVICGALRYTENSTSDETAAKLSHYLKSDFINMTNVKGLYTSDPYKDKNARFIQNISWNEFEKKAKKLKYRAGQHFILDQKAATIIKKNKIKTYIISSDTENLSNLLNKKKFIGTTISN